MSSDRNQKKIVSLRYRTTVRSALMAGLGLATSLALLSGCASSAATSASSILSSAGVTTASDTAASGEAVTLVDTSSVFSDRNLDASYDEAAATRIELSDAGSTSTGTGVTISGSTITITEEGVYIVSGTLADGQIVVDAAEDAKVQIVLDGADITSSDAAAIYVVSADKVFVTLAEGSSNSLAVTGSFAATDDGNTVDGAIFSKADLTIQGEGALSVVCAAGHGIVSKDELTITGGTISVEASGHALQAKDALAISGGTLDLVAGTDALHCSDDEDAEHGWIYISGGTITAEATSDAIDAGSFLEIDGGDITVTAGDDGLHAEYAAVVNGGTITVTQSTEALEGSAVTITGGTLDLVSSDDGINAAGEPTETDGAAEGSAGQGSVPSAGMGAAGGMENDETASVTITGGHGHDRGGRRRDRLERQPHDCRRLHLHQRA